MASADKGYASTKADKQAAQARIDQEKQIDILYAQIGRLTTQLDWLKKNLKESTSRNEREALVERDLGETHLTIKDQADLLR